MDNEEKLIAFGPVPSRRLGHSMGINNIPPKICTYSCVYCQVGRTMRMQVRREEFYKPDDIIREVERKVEEAGKRNETIDYLTFVSDGEPTLDMNLGLEITRLRKLGIRMAIITNASLMGMEEVRGDLGLLDWVSVKVDGVSGDVWRKIDRPHGTLDLDIILAGVSEFARDFSGFLATETMLLEGMNDGHEELEKIARFIGSLNPGGSYLSIPTRPPAEMKARPAGESALASAYQLFTEKGINTEYLIGYEGNAFAFTGDVEKDLLSITAVHPMRKDAVEEYLHKADAGWEAVNRLIAENKILEISHRENVFYLRQFPNSQQRKS